MPNANEPIAIVAAAAHYPGRGGLGGFWQDILEGRDQIREIPADYWRIEDYYDPDPKAVDKTYAKTGAFLDPFKLNPLEFGLPPTQLPATDTAQILALVLAKTVLDQALAVLGEAGMARQRTSVILGVASATELVTHLGSRLQRPIWRKAMREAGLSDTRAEEICERITAHYAPWQEASFPGLLGNVVAGRIANRFDLGGSNFVTDAACASSLAAVLAGVNELKLGQSDAVICGGVDAINDIFMYMCFSKTPALSPTGHARPFSASADGTILGEGGGMVMLRRLADAERDGNQILALLTGIGQGSDGKGTAIYAPKVAGQALALRRAYAASGFTPKDVELVEAHGTATAAGDATEVKALQEVYGPATEGEGPWCALGSVKSQIGHTKAAAGLAGLLKVALALHHKVLPPTIKVGAPTTALQANSAFYLNTGARPWIRGPGRPRRAAVSAFGFGGSNFHVTLEEYTGKAKSDRLRVKPNELFLFSGNDLHILTSEIEALSAALSLPYDHFALTSDREWTLRDKARTSQEGFDPTHLWRLALVAPVADADTQVFARAAQLLRAQSHAEAQLRSIEVPGIALECGHAAPGKIAFLFPGQGSQSLGMSGTLAMHDAGAREAWDRAASHPRFTAQPLHRYVFPAPAHTDEMRAAQDALLADQRVVQPTLAVASLAYLHALAGLGVRPDMLAGHSFGELTALHAAGVLDESAFLEAAAARGMAMFTAGSDARGGMTALTAPADIARALITELDDGLTLANDNGPHQTVVSGALADLERLEKLAAARGIRATRLRVSAALHSPLVAEAAAPFAAALAPLRFATPQVPTFANGSAAPYLADPAAIRNQIGTALARPVRFREMVAAMAQAGARIFIEVGPGAVLTRLASSCLPAGEARFIALDSRGGDSHAAFLLASGRLALAGVPLDLAASWTSAPLPPPPQKAGPMTIAVTGTNLGKPYPNNAAAPITPPAPPTLSEPSTPATTPPAPEETVMSASRSNLDALSTIHAQMGEAHQRFQEAMFQSHKDYLEASGHVLRQLVGGLPPVGETQAIAPPVPAAAPAPAAPVIATMPAATLLPLPSSVAVPVVAPVAAPIITPSPTPVPVAPAPINIAPLAPSPALLQVVREVVAEKTGYPADMLEPDMDLEGDLGIDSIKQVEILSTLRERLPNLPQIEPAQLAELRTLAQLADQLQGAVGSDAEKKIPALT
ncbi:MAG: hypothetical protein B7X08_06465 [Acidocella sp. 20-63-7]|nr:MAG: hypothetical protein B7X08_06465 [Acidocella sp. 20-63-7]